MLSTVLHVYIMVFFKIQDVLEIMYFFKYCKSPVTLFEPLIYQVDSLKNVKPTLKL